MKPKIVARDRSRDCQVQEPIRIEISVEASLSQTLRGSSKNGRKLNKPIAGSRKTRSCLLYFAVPTILEPGKKLLLKRLGSTGPEASKITVDVMPSVHLIKSIILTIQSCE